ncbi:mast cell-expressed membrane protein 1 [Tachyglossus aculeatus]|uniref:mast cell-expressed membrane protein 1 n=1 Tax=Tachyglossus aculeatus TaxID=9261 RepID=UPI0018F297F1|nr:mast cell-expressed membrane protein 1 [Tachyglossus aculeatus]
MEPADIYMNQKLDTEQTWKSKKKRHPKADHVEKKDDPEYENITMTFKKQHDLGIPSSPPAVPAPIVPGPSKLSVPGWVHKSIMSLYVLLVFSFMLSIIFFLLVLVKISQVSQELENVQLALSNSIQNELNTTAMNFSSRMDAIESKVKTLNEKLQKNLDLSGQLKKLESALKTLMGRLTPPAKETSEG